MVDRYYCQRFVGIESKVAHYRGCLPGLEVVGPIVNTSFFRGTHRENKCLINFGGLNNRFIRIGENSSYPFVMLDAIASVVRKAKFDRVIVTGTDAVAATIREARYDLDFQYETLSHERFLQELSGASCLVTSPGLETPYEAFAYGVPVFFLPEQHNSQVFQLTAFAAHNVAPFRCSWSQMFPDFHLKLGEFDSQGQEIELVLDCIRRFECAEAPKRVLQKSLDEFLSETAGWFDVVNEQSTFMRNLGSNGADVIVNQILAQTSKK